MVKHRGQRRALALVFSALIFCAALETVPAQGAVDASAADVVLGFDAVPTSIGLIPQWAQMMGRFSDEVRGSGRSTWDGIVAQFHSMDLGSAVAAVNRYVNRIDYVSDHAGWHQGDYWETPLELFARGGDCEDYAIAKFLILKALGVPVADMRILMLRGRGGDDDHAVLLVRTAAGPLILDNQRGQPYRYGEGTASQVAYAFNDEQMWLTLGR